MRGGSPWTWFFGAIFLSWTFNGFFPFWRYAMYSHVFKEMRSIIFLSQEKIISLDDFTGFEEPIGEYIITEIGDRAHYINLSCHPRGLLPHDRYLVVDQLRGYVASRLISGRGRSGLVPVAMTLRDVRWDRASDKILVSDRVLWRTLALQAR